RAPQPRRTRPPRRRPPRGPDGAGGQCHHSGQHPPHAQSSRGPHGTGSPPMQDRLATLFYNTAYAVCFTGTTLAWSFRFEGGRDMRVRGPALVLANHESLLDPVLVGVSSPRRLRSLARKTLFRNPAFAWLIRSLGAAPVDQEGVAKEGLKAVLRELEQGQAV